MSKDFSAFATLPFIGAPYGVPSSECRMSAVAPALAPFFINWLNYGASSARPKIAVQINIQTGAATPPIDVIQSVFIDNNDSLVPIYVYFPDTQFVASMPPNSSGWIKVLTNGLVALICGDGFATGSIPSTRVIFSNVNMASFIDPQIQATTPLYKASPAISRGNNIFTTGLGIPALGDQIGSIFIPADNSQNVPLFPVMTKGYYYLNAFNVSQQQVLRNAAGTTIVELRVKSNGVSGTLFTVRYPAGNDSDRYTLLIALNGMQVKIDATELWFGDIEPSSVVPNGKFGLIYTYTYSET